MRPYIFALAVIFLLSGCGGSPKPTVEVKPKPLPAWIMNPPVSDSSTLYGVGEGKNKEEAISNALSEIISTLSISVKSEYKSKTTVKNLNGFENYSQEVEQKISSNVKELRVSHYELLKYEKTGFGKYAVLIKSDRSLLFNSLKDEADQAMTLLKDEEFSYKTANILEQLNFYKKASDEVDELVYKSVILKVLNPSFDDRHIIKTISYFKENYTSLKSKISFSIESDDDSKNLIPVVKDTLTSKGFKFAKHKDSYHLHVSINSNIIYSAAYGFDLARSDIVINIKDAQKQVIVTRKIDITGQSTQGSRVAKQNIAIKLKSYLSNTDIL